MLGGGERDLSGTPTSHKSSHFNPLYQAQFVPGSGRRHTALRTHDALDVISFHEEGLTMLPKWLRDVAYPQQDRLL